MFCVITKVPDPREESGNLAIGVDSIFVDPQAIRGRITDKPIPILEFLKDTIPQLGLYLRTPVFNLGELLILDENDRDQFGRKPSKWYIQYETFTDIKDAVACVEKVTTRKKEDDGT